MREAAAELAEEPSNELAVEHELNRQAEPIQAAAEEAGLIHEAATEHNEGRDEKALQD